MTKMKRTKRIDLEFMRQSSNKIGLKPFVLAITSVLTGCGANLNQQATVVKSVSDCTASTDLTQAQCETAYQQALAETEKTAPKYNTQQQCEEEFGFNQCNRSSSGFFIPFMAGWMVSNALDFNRHSFNPVYQYQGQNRFNNQFMTADGRVLGPVGRSTYRVNAKDLTQPVTPVKRTISRGGFGSQAAAKSNWGSSRNSGWGG